MGRHSLATDRTAVTVKTQQPPTSHRRPEEWNGRQVILAPANADHAVVVADQAIVFSKRFLNAVEETYTENRIGRIPGRPFGRVMELVGAKLRERPDLPMWNNVDLRTTLFYLASKGKIKLPEGYAASR